MVVGCTRPIGRRYEFFSGVNPHAVRTGSVSLRVTMLGWQIMALRPRHWVRCWILVGVGKTRDMESVVGWVYWHKLSLVMKMMARSRP